MQSMTPEQIRANRMNLRQQLQLSNITKSQDTVPLERNISERTTETSSTDFE